MEYNKEAAIQELINKIGWKPYEGKHFESTNSFFFFKKATNGSSF
jgi:hypothetical protein